MDKQLIVDTKLGLGKYVRQSKHFPIQEANIHQRVLSDSGKLLLGAHILLKPADIALAHGFIGFMGDLRMLKTSTDGSKLVNLLFCENKELTSGSTHCGAATSGLHVLMQHQVGSESTNSISGKPLQPRYVKGYLPGDGQTSSVPVLKWDKKLGPQMPPACRYISMAQQHARPVHPLMMDSTEVLNIDSLPGPTLSAEQLRATWPKELSPPRDVIEDDRVYQYIGQKQ
eukprot:symbB.v1.2.009444.t1/scaffold601.1/size182750/8